MKNKTIEIKKEGYPNPLNLTTRFLSARPDLVGAWIAGAHGLLPVFKTEYKDAVIAFLECVEQQFFTALNNQVNKRIKRELHMFGLGQIIRNKHSGKERMVIGIKPADPKDQYAYNIYHYINDDGREGACASSTLQEWQWKK